MTTAKINPEIVSRIVAAADRLAGAMPDGKSPAVADVRREARASTNDAVSVMRTWRAARLRPMKATEKEVPPSVKEAAADAIAAIWMAAEGEAIKLVDATRAQAAEDAAAAESLARELAAEVDTVTADAIASKADAAKAHTEATSARVDLETARAQVVSLTERLAAAAERLIEMRADLDAARAAERTARDEASNLRGELKALTPKCGSATQ
jgi:chromosome segregation ATPase